LATFMDSSPAGPTGSIRFFYFPGLLLASAAMGAYIGGSSWGHLAQNRSFLLGGSVLLLFVAVGMNIVGLNIGKWLQNAGGVMTYIPLLLLAGTGALVWMRYGYGDAFHVVEHAAAMELGNGEFLAANSIRGSRVWNSSRR